MKNVILLILIVAAVIAFCKRNAIVGYFSMSREQVSVNTEGLIKKPSLSGKKTLIVFFSWGGNTRKVAHYIQDQIGGDLFEIQTKDPNHYPKDYKTTTERARDEIQSQRLPELAQLPASLDAYEYILVGYPIWWHAAPLVVQKFLQSYDLSHHILIPFATSGGDSVEETMASLKKSAPKSTIRDGITANILRQINPWLRDNGLL